MNPEIFILIGIVSVLAMVAVMVYISAKWMKHHQKEGKSNIENSIVALLNFLIPGTGFIYIGKAKFIIAGILLLLHIGLLFYRTFNKDPIVDAVAYLSFAIAMAVIASACAELVNEKEKRSGL